MINAKRKGDTKDEALFNVEVNSMGIRIGKEHTRDAAVIEIGVKK